MRRQKTWLCMVSMLALLLGAIPGSVFSSLFATSCKMDCCVGKPTHQMVDPVCPKGCEMEKRLPSKSSSSFCEKGPDVCRCSISSAPSTPQPDAAATTCSLLQIPQFVADIPVDAGFVLILSDLESNPGILGSDSGPPLSRPQYVSLGRAPPRA